MREAIDGLTGLNGKPNGSGRLFRVHSENSIGQITHSNLRTVGATGKSLDKCHSHMTEKRPPLKRTKEDASQNGLVPE